MILTDFEEFRVFNALKKPKIDLPLEGVLKPYDLTFDKYLDKWDLLYEHFSREAVADGSLEKWKGKLSKKTKTLDREFLEEITHWREMLAKEIYLAEKRENDYEKNNKTNVDLHFEKLIQDSEFKKIW